MKRCLKILVLITLVLMLTGCWNNRDLTDLAIVVGIAIDKAEDGQVEIMAQIVKPESIMSGKEGSGTDKKGFVNISSKGETMFEVIRSLLPKINKKGYFAQMQLMVISEDAARDGISNYFDFFERDTETRRRAYLLISKGMKASTVLDSESQITNLPATHEVDALEASKSYGKTLKVNIIDILKNLNNASCDNVLPVIYNSKQTEKVSQEDLFLEGSAIIKKDKLVDFLEPLQTRGFLFADDEIRSTIINAPCPENPEKTVSVEVIRSKGKIDAKMKNGKPVLSINVKAEGNIGEQQGYADLTKPDYLNALEKEVRQEIKKEIQDAVKITQQNQSDVFRFIDKIYKNYYSDWEKIIKDWREIYSKTPVDVSVEFEIRRPGLIKNPTKPK